MMNSTLVEQAVDARGLVVHRGKNQVLHGIDLQLEKGSVTGFMGPSGCGKTTFMRAMVGVQRITSGTLTMLGKPAGHPELRHRIGYTSQAVSIYRDLSVRDNVAHFARLVGAGNDAVAQALEDVQLQDYATRQVQNLSGGQANRASLACALVGSPGLLILDEPTVGLDPLTRESLWQTFRSLAERGITLIVASHVMDEARHCDKVALMRDGRFLAHAPIQELLGGSGTTNPEAAFLAIIRQQEVAA